MKLHYTAAGRFVPETQAIVEQLKADAVIMLVFGSRTKGSGACCEMRVEDPEGMARIIITEMRALADAIETDLEQGSLKHAEMTDDHNGHEQTEQQYSPRGLRPGAPDPGDHI